MIPSVGSVLSLWGALSEGHLLHLASIEAPGGTVFWQVVATR
jgi:hypothetical protein